MNRPTTTQREEARHPASNARVVMRQRWENLLFLHWTVDRETIQRTLPPDLYADTFAGTGWLGIVPFAMRDVRPAGLPAVGRLSNFLELNVRTYVHDANGVPGVWFYSLDCNQPLAVWVARTFFHLPYQHAAMEAEFGDAITYRTKRKGSAEESAFAWTPRGPTRTAAPASLEFFLLERYFLYAAKGSRLFRGQVAHTPYEYQDAGVSALSSLPAAQAGFTGLSATPQHACHAPGVDVRILGLQQLA
jgi:uncharacterized protein YqjF (DUF2071 family)